MSFLSGFVAIVGPPNVGKSTLLNRILGRKAAIVSPKPQTTRNRILGVLDGSDFQVVFMDTPGIHQTKTALHKSMVESARSACREVDRIVLVIDVRRPYDPELSMIMKTLREAGKETLLVINKIDTLPREQLLPIIEYFSGAYPFESIIPVSALRGEGVGTVVKEIKSHLSPGVRYYPADMQNVQTENFFISEMIREKIYLHTKKELPYSSAVTVDRIDEMPLRGLISIGARIHVESESQKRILIGKGGRMIKTIGRSSRFALEKRFGCKIFLDLVVRVEKNWSKDARALRRLGY